MIEFYVENAIMLIKLDRTSLHRQNYGCLNTYENMQVSSKQNWKTGQPMKIKMNTSNAGCGGMRCSHLALTTIFEVFLQNRGAKKGVLFRPFSKQLSQNGFFLEVFVKQRSQKEPFLRRLCKTV